MSDAIGHSVPGTSGETAADQDRIDEHVARACAARVYTREECARHTKVSAARRQELAEERADISGAGV